MRSKPCSWTAIAWLPVIDEEKSTRPTQGYDSDAARNVRLFHACWNLLLKTWPEDTENTRVVSYGDNKARVTRHFVGALLGDMQVLTMMVIFCVLINILHIYNIMHIQEFDKWTCEPHPICHRCPAGILEFLRTDLPFAPKSMLVRQDEITYEASGEGIRDRGVRGVVDGSIVEWDEDGSNVRPGPNKSNYESARKECGAHLLFNAFWRIKHFCVQQMLPRDGMHAIDLGALIRLILAILRKYWECVEKELGQEGLAAALLEARLRMYLARRTGPDDQV